MKPSIKFILPLFSIAFAALIELEKEPTVEAVLPTDSQWAFTFEKTKEPTFKRPFIYKFDNATKYVAAEKKMLANNNGQMLAIVNREDPSITKDTINVSPSVTYGKEGINGLPVQFPGVNNTLVNLKPGEILVTGNWPDWYRRGHGHVQYSSTIASWYADPSGNFSYGISGTEALVEFQFGGNPNRTGVDLSMVNGIQVPIHVEFPMKGTDCKPLSCRITQEHILEKCPKSNLEVIGGYATCKSDCCTTNSTEHCCTPPFDKHGACKSSNPYFAGMCDTTYLWPHDDAQYQDCNAQGLMVVYLGSGNSTIHQ
ncbi:hypothetical protein B0J14DRAFT_569636 [Halenospora varia]|nr:hypothetical protein B0J14DRAFT_569636 [Halenospora varia]